MAKVRGTVLDDHARAVELRTRGYGAAAMIIGLLLIGLLPAVGLGTQMLIVAMGDAATEAPPRPRRP